MQYLLSEEEYQELKQAPDNVKKDLENTLQKLCTMVADHMPIKWGWGNNPNVPKPWECIHSANDEWYCDQCPVLHLCPEPAKSFSQ